MKRTEMNKKQLRVFHFIIDYLQNNKWTYDGDISWFSDNTWEEPEIGMIYDNKSMSLLVEYTLKEDLLTLRLTSKRNGKEIIFDIFPEEKLKECLEYLTINQDKINSKNYQHHIRSILEICPKIFTYRDNVAYRLKPDL